MAKINKDSNNTAPVQMTEHEVKIAAEVNEMAADENVVVPDEPKMSPKNKKRLGIPDSHVISWVPMDSPKEYNEMLNNVARVRNVNVGKMLADILKEALKAQETELRKEAAKYVPSTGATSKTVEKLSKMTPAQQQEFFTAELEKMVGLLMKAGLTEEAARAMAFKK